MFKKKYGFSLIEVNIALLIQLIVMTLAINALIVSFKGYYNLLNNSKIQDPFDDSILNIERLLTGSMIQNIEIHEDSLNSKGEILITYKLDNNKPDIKKKKIFYDSYNKKIVVETYNKNDFKIGVNTIMIYVNEFRVVKKNKIYYLKITGLNNNERIICL